MGYKEPLSILAGKRAVLSQRTFCGDMLVMYISPISTLISQQETLNASILRVMKSRFHTLEDTFVGHLSYSSDSVKYLHVD